MLIMVIVISCTPYRCRCISRLELDAQLLCDMEWAPAKGLFWWRYHIERASHQLVILVHGCGLRLTSLVKEERVYVICGWTHKADALVHTPSVVLYSLWNFQLASTVALRLFPDNAPIQDNPRFFILHDIAAIFYIFLVRLWEVFERAVQKARLIPVHHQVHWKLALIPDQVRPVLLLLFLIWSGRGS